MVTNPSLWLIPKVAQQKIRTELRFELPSKKTAFKVKTIKKKKKHSSEDWNSSESPRHDIHSIYVKIKNYCTMKNQEGVTNSQERRLSLKINPKMTQIL